LTLERVDVAIASLNRLKVQFKNNDLIIEFIDEIIAFIIEKSEEMNKLEDENAIIILNG
jgi:hypothetical protein